MRSRVGVGEALGNGAFDSLGVDPVVVGAAIDRGMLRRCECAEPENAPVQGLPPPWSRGGERVVILGEARRALGNRGGLGFSTGSGGTAASKGGAVSEMVSSTRLAMGRAFQKKVPRTTREMTAAASRGVRNRFSLTSGVSDISRRHCCARGARVMNVAHRAPVYEGNRIANGRVFAYGQCFSREGGRAGVNARRTGGGVRRLGTGAAESF